MPLDDRPAKPAAGARRSEIAARLAATRALSLEIAAPLTPEDQVVQAMDDASPTKWHLGHTTWFFEELVLKRFSPGYRVFDERFAYCFNSYYESLGPRHPRPRRGLLTRPSAEEVRAYRACVDESLNALLAGSVPEEALGLIEVGINHEQQHQELMLTDILALFAANPLRPAYREASAAPAEGARRWALAASFRRRPRNRAPRRRLRLRQRRPRPSRSFARFPVVQPRSDQRRVARLHGGRRLFRAVALAFRRLGHGAPRRMASARLLGAERTGAGTK